MVERTLILLKPDTIERSLVGNILTRIEQLRGKIIAMKMVQANRELILKHYNRSGEWFEFIGSHIMEDCRKVGIEPMAEFGTIDPHDVGHTLYERLVTFMISAPLIAIILEGEDVVRKVRAIIGHTTPSKADPTSIRGSYGIDDRLTLKERTKSVKNLMHASGNVAEAVEEISLWFPELNYQA